VAKKSFGAFLRDAVFTPAGMKGSFVYEGPKAAPRQGPAHAVGNTKGEKGGWEASWDSPPVRDEKLLTVGDGGVWSSVEDLLRWDAALRAGKLLKPATMREALKPSRTRDGKTNNYGLGWSLYPGEGGALNGYGHDGSWAGFRTSYYRYLAADRTTILLSNKGDFDPDKFWYALNDVLEEQLKGK